MGIIIDVIIIAIVVLSAFLAYRRGLAVLAINLCAFVISIVAVGILYYPISSLIINTTSIDETIENAIYEKANEHIQSDGEYTSQIIEVAKSGMLPETAKMLSINIVRGLVMVVLFVAIRVALIFVKGLANIITKLPIINQFNKLGGAVYGALRGIVIIYVALLILQLPAKMNPNNIVYKNVQESFVGKTMYENNIFNYFFKVIEK